MAAYYNEIDKHAAKWLRNLIAAGLIADGDVDERDIRDVRPNDICKYTQCHFFAGIGVWSHALRRADWSDDRPVWTGSCPCQPFSAAGKGSGFDDERHLWPAWHHLICECRPARVFGEQVASLDGLGWLDLVQADMEGENYACGRVDLCAAGVGAPHIRQRLWFVAKRLDHANGKRLERHTRNGSATRRQGSVRSIAATGVSLRLANAPMRGRQQQSDAGSASLLGATAAPEKQMQQSGPDGTGMGSECADPTNGFWRDADWLGCRDGKWRPVEPGTFPLAYGATARVGRLRAYGNAINVEAAMHVINAVKNRL